MISQLCPILLLVMTCATQISIMAKEKSHYALADKISSLPGQPKVNFQQYSGYITIDEKQKRSLFYYFVEAETKPDSKPLVLWLNGGPGCSSIGAGAFSEHGPFQPSGNVLVKNNYSWNKVANMLYLESPAGVGFSYSANNESVNDEITARENLIFLQKWFEKFPELKNSEFFITGESYAGHYVPQLAKLIIASKEIKFNLKGIAIGNPLLELNTDSNSAYEFLWSHGLISDTTFGRITSLCNYSQTIGKRTRNCSRVLNEASSEIGNLIDAYDVTLDVCLLSISQQSRVLNRLNNQPKIDVCIEDETYAYLNRKDVRKALHARLVGVGNWSMCSDVLPYDWRNLEIPTIGILGSLVKSGIRVLVYSGDQDSAIPFIGTRKLVNSLADDLNLRTTRPYRAWITKHQVAGWTQSYGNNILSYATIRGASHEAPFSQPERSLVLFTSFLSGKPLPPANR